MNSPHEKLAIKDFTSRYHPSTMTNKSNLKGSDIMTGGSINIPMDISTLAITRSIIIKGI
jgi:hypothetical protein